MVGRVVLVVGATDVVVEEEEAAVAMEEAAVVAVVAVVVEEEDPTSFSKSEALVGGDAPNGDGFWGAREVMVLRGGMVPLLAGFALFGGFGGWEGLPVYTTPSIAESSSESRTNSADLTLVLVVTASFFCAGFFSFALDACVALLGSFDNRRLDWASLSLTLVFLIGSCDLDLTIDDPP